MPTIAQGEGESTRKRKDAEAAPRRNRGSPVPGKENSARPALEPVSKPHAEVPTSASSGGSKAGSHENTRNRRLLQLYDTIPEKSSARKDARRSCSTVMRSAGRGARGEPPS